MKSLTKLVLLCLIFPSNLVFSQFDKETFNTLLTSINVNSYQKVRVFSSGLSDSKTKDYINLEGSTFKYFLGEEIVTLIDGKGLIIYIPYHQIKIIKIAPQTGTRISNLSIYLMD